MATNTLGQTFVKSGVLHLLLHIFAQLLCLILSNGNRIGISRIHRSFCKHANHFCSRIINHASNELLVQDEAVQVIRKTATDIGTDDRQRRNRIGNGKVTGHGNELRSSLAERGATQFNFKRNFHFGTIKVLHIKGCVIGPQLEVHGRFDIDNREQINPQLETEALHRAVKTAMLQRNRTI